MNKMPESIREELMALAAKSDNEIDFSDIPATTGQDWDGAVRGKFYRPIEQQLMVYVDSDVLVWLKSKGKDYQACINTILREAMLREVDKV